MSQITSILEIKQQFFRLYGETTDPLSVFFAPGRVNLIGEHTDYNGGYVFPCALTFGTYLAIRKSDDPFFSFSSGNREESYRVDIRPPCQAVEGAWINYPLGVIDQLTRKGNTFPGLQFYFSGDIPNGAGLSSSASLEMVTAFALNHLFQLGIKAEDLARICQQAENQFAGMNCGIMDQFASALGKKDHAIFLNCKTMNYVHVPLKLGAYSLVIANTNKQRGLLDSKYNERRRECEEALADLQQFRNWKFLGEVAFEDFEAAEDAIKDDTLFKRALHVVTENKRVLEAAKALHRNDLPFFGKLMQASHESLKTLYEVSCFELDVLAEEACKFPGVLGARMTGGGFGGCTVNLVKTDFIGEFISKVGGIYRERTGLLADFYVPEIGDGARLIEGKR